MLYRAQMPPWSRNVESPDSAEIPAPVKMKMRFAIMEPPPLLKRQPDIGFPETATSVDAFSPIRFGVLRGHAEGKAPECASLQSSPSWPCPRRQRPVRTAPAT